MSSLLRPITPNDHASVLALNERNVALLAPLEEPRLLQLIGWSDTAAVIDVDGEFAGFVLTFASGSAYDGENFAWFGERHEEYAYLDRIVIHQDFRRRGLGTRVYDELEAGCGRPVFTLEVNVDPPNEPSLAFHRARGYAEIGQRLLDPGTPTAHSIAMMTKQLSS